MRIGDGLPSTSAGENSICCAAATAASSKPWPAPLTTVAAVTCPATSRSSASVTSPASPAANASGGYSGSTFFVTTGAFVSLGAAGSGARGGGSG